MTKKEKKIVIAEVVKRLKDVYPEAACALQWGGEEPWKLLVMGRLSAQCTDKRVNIVCEELFAHFPTLSSLADAPVCEIEEIIKPCGLFRTKAANIKDSLTMLRDEFDSVLPDDMDELLRLPGVGRKIANLLRGDVYKYPAIVADTHCMRICGRLGMYREDLRDPYKVEKILSELVEPDEQSDFCHRIVEFGRDTCSARAPKCDACALADICAHYAKNIN